MPDRPLFVPVSGAPGVAEPCHNSVWYDLTTGNCHECNEATHVYNQTPITRTMLSDFTQYGVEWKRAYLPVITTTDATEQVMYTSDVIPEGGVVYYRAVIQCKQALIAGSSNMILEGYLERPIGLSLLISAPDVLQVGGLPTGSVLIKTVLGAGNTFTIHAKGKTAITYKWSGRVEVQRLI